MEAASKAVISVIRVLVGTCLILSVLLICANAAARYIFLAPIIWAEEVLGYVLVWTVYLGAVLVSWDGGHLRMDLVSRTLRGPARYAVNGLATAAFLVIGAIIVWQSRFAIAEFTHHSQVAELPMNVVHLVLPIAFGLIVLCILVRLRANVAGTIEPGAPAGGGDAPGGGNAG